MDFGFDFNNYDDQSDRPKKYLRPTDVTENN